jgi:hypothetical protein
MNLRVQIFVLRYCGSRCELAEFAEIALAVQDNTAAHVGFSLCHNLVRCRFADVARLVCGRTGQPRQGSSIAQVSFGWCVHMFGDSCSLQAVN